jgi:cation diffusion facilitator CzcD-associated flavoprotein CzcO
MSDHDVIIIGSGFAGLGAAIQLSQAGRDDFVVLEQADSVGGTWRANHYPGCACDVPTPYYSFSFAPKPDWSRFYAPYDEIRAYLEDCADRFGIRDRLRFGQQVSGLAWDDPTQRWTVDVGGAAAFTARVVIAAPGGLSRPAYPDVEGLADFAGPWFHSAEWDHDVDLDGARVAVIGTGASAIQLVPEVARTAAHVDVFQRTPPWVLPKPDRRIGPLEQRLYRFRLPRAGMRGLVWAMQEYQGLANTRLSLLSRPLEAVGYAFIRRSISDPDLADRLTPRYRIGCKRILLANDWYSTLAKPHVDVVSDGIERVTARGIRTADGVEHPADVIVFGTGFRATDPLGDLRVAGRDGADLGAAWAGGMEAHRGTTIAGFPNFFLMPGPNTGTGHTSQVFMIEQQVGHIVAALERMDARGAATIEPRPDAQRAYNAALQARMAKTVWLRGGCTSWYLDANGRNTTLWPYSSLRFRRDLGTIDDAEFTFTAPMAAPVLEEVR